VLLVLPEQPSQLLNRALLYTAISRGKQRVEIWALAPRIGEAVAGKALRAAGLALRLRQHEAKAPVAPLAGSQASLF
jgi:exodeoxyribonuclease V alpha subunit